MSHGQKYREAFVKDSFVINIAKNISLMSKHKYACLKIDSYDIPNYAILYIGGDIDEDIEFGGIVYIDVSVENYGHITCKHIYFSKHSCCHFSQITADSVEVNMRAKIKFAHNESIIGFIGVAGIPNVQEYFPNLLISSQIRKFGTDLVCFCINSKYTRLLIDKTHYCYPAIEHLSVGKNIYLNGKNSIVLEICNINNKSKFYTMAKMLIVMVAAIKNYNQPLIKNAYNL